MAPMYSSATVPPLAPSVEEAYRRKCIQLKQRNNEVEEANDAARLRLARIKRQIEKLRLERALLLEHLQRRTSANVEDSDGSPSPPPTPQDKPLRTKRGHRKPSMLADIDPKAAPSDSLDKNNNGSPGSETFSTQAKDSQDVAGSGRSAANGASSRPPKRPASAFDMYCADARKAKAAEGGAEGGADGDLEEELARGWKELPEQDKDEYAARYERAMDKWQQDKQEFQQKAREKAEADEDVEMANYDTEEPE